MNIEKIKEFTKNKDAWYHVTVPDYMCNEDIMRIKAIFDNSQLDGTFLVTGSDTKIRDITEYMTKHRIKEVESHKHQNTIKEDK